MRSIIKKLRNKAGIGILELILLVIVIAAFVVILIKWHDDEIKQVSKIDTEYITPTAGITYYMARLEYHCMQNAVPVEVEEPKIEVVSEPYFMDEARELEENYDEMIQNAEDSSEYFIGWMELIGYVPEDWEVEEAIQMTMDENGYQDDETIADTFSVICNRVRSPQFPNTIHEVLYQKNQFQPVVDGTVGKFVITDKVREICSDIISEGVTNSEILYFTAGGYNPYCEPMYQRENTYFGK